MLFGNVLGNRFLLVIVLALICVASAYNLHTSLGNGVCNVTLKAVDKRMEFSLQARSTGWVALSLNKDKTHEQADVYFAFYDSAHIIRLKDCTIPKGSHHITLDANAQGTDLVISTSTNKDPGIIRLNFHRNTDTGDVQDIVLKPGNLYMQCATGPSIGQSGYYKFLKAQQVEDLRWTTPVKIFIHPFLTPTPLTTSEKHLNSEVTTTKNNTDTSGGNETATVPSTPKTKDRFYDLQPILVLLTVSGVVTSIIVMVVFCKCNKTRQAKSNMAVAFYKGNTSWSDCSDEEDERMAFLNDNKDV